MTNTTFHFIQKRSHAFFPTQATSPSDTLNLAILKGLLTLATYQDEDEDVYGSRDRDRLIQAAIEAELEQHEALNALRQNGDGETPEECENCPLKECTHYDSGFDL